MRSPVLRHVSPRTLRLRIVFSFLLGVVVTATLFSAAWLELGRCAAGEQCTNTGHRLRRVLSVFGAAAVPWSTVDGPYTDTGATTATSSSTHRLLESTVSATTPTVGTTGVRRWRATISGVGSPTARPLTRQSHGTWFDHIRPTRPPKIGQHSSTDARPSSSVNQLIPDLKVGKRRFRVPKETQQPITDRIKQVCTETKYCRELLSPPEENHFTNCSKKCQKKSAKFGSAVNGTCRFMDGRDRLPVALASFPGSGNTWTRGLLEEVTGVCTGALYCDCGLRVGGFNGEGVQGSSVLVTKTHNRKVQFVGGHIFSTSRIPYGAAVLLVRDPRGALVAEWNRERSNRVVSPNVSNHFTYVGEEYFGENKDWNRFIHIKLSRWPQQMVNLLLEAKTSSRPIHVLKFEDLKADTVGEMKKLTDFLGFSFTEKEVADRLEVGFSKFYRNHTAEFSHFTPVQERYVTNVVNRTSQFMKFRHIYDMFPRIDEYI